MKEEEKKAIETFNNYINEIETFGTIDPKCCNNLYEPAIALLNLIETQKHTIEGKEALIDTMTHNEEVFNEIIENKNKIISLMAENLTTPINGKEWVIEYYTKLAEEEK